jgi:hypothetical protein
MLATNGFNLRLPAIPRLLLLIFQEMLSGLGCAAINNTDIINTAFDAHDKILQIFWTGAKYAVTCKLDVIVAYYHYNQNNFAAGPPCKEVVPVV